MGRRIFKFTWNEDSFMFKVRTWRGHGRDRIFRRWFLVNLYYFTVTINKPE